MNVWFGCSTAEIEKYAAHYFAIRNFLVSEGHVILHDWLVQSREDVQNRKRRHGAERIYHDVITAINKADLLIIEDTVSNFSTGHQITLGIQRQKPVLVLWNGNKNRYFKDTFLHGIKSPYLQISQYDLNNYQEIVRSFINKFSHAGEQHRFNLVIDEVERKYLEWAKYKYQKSRTQVIKESLRAKIDQDPDYQEYLNQEDTEITL